MRNCFGSAGGIEDGGEFVGWDGFELGVGAGLREFVCAPAAELRHVAEARALHVLVGDLENELGAEGLQERSLAPVQRDLPPGMRCGSDADCPGVSGVVAAMASGRSEVWAGAGWFWSSQSDQGWFARALVRYWARRVTSSARLGAVKLAQVPTCCRWPAVVVEAEEERADEGLFVSAIFVPAEACDDAVAVALVLDLQHGALVGLVGAGEWLGDDAVEAGALEAAEPVLGEGAVVGGGGEVDGRGFGVGESALRGGAANRRRARG